MYTLLISSSHSLQTHLSAALGSFVEAAANVADLIDQRRWQRGDVVWIDADNQAHELIEQLCRGALGPVRVIVMSSAPDDLKAVRWLGSGAAGYVHAFSSPETLRQTLSVVESGGMWVGVSLMQQLCARFGQLPGINASAYPAELTTREKDVIDQLRLGKSNKQIARDLDITERTVKAHLSAIFTKLQVTDRVQLLLKLASPVVADI